MSMSNASSKPLFYKNGTLPDVSGAIQDYFQPMVFNLLTKSVSGFQALEKSTTQPLNFRGLIQPYTERRLMLLPEGQRAWSWYELHADPSLTLQVDDVVIWMGKQTRVMSRTDYALYGYVSYHLIQDYTGVGP
jgi:hypothetical protein